MAKDGRVLFPDLVKSLLDGVEMYERENRWAEIKRYFFDGEENLTTYKLKRIWKKLVKMANNPAHRKGVDRLSEKTWAKVRNLEAKGSVEKN